MNKNSNTPRTRRRIERKHESETKKKNSNKFLLLKCIVF